MKDKIGFPVGTVANLNLAFAVIMQFAVPTTIARASLSVLRLQQLFLHTRQLSLLSKLPLR